MAIYIGNTKLQSSNKVYVGTSEIKNIYIDNNLVWQSYVPPVVLFGTLQGTMDAQYNQGNFGVSLPDTNLFATYSEIVVRILQPSMHGHYGAADISVFGYDTTYIGPDNAYVRLYVSGGNTWFDQSMSVSGAIGEPRVTYVLGVI